MEEELIAGRLYSGPLRAKYQAALQALDSRVPARHARFVELCSDEHHLTKYRAEAASIDPLVAFEAARPACNSYSTTIHVIKSLLLTCGRLMRAAVLYRGVSGFAPPRQFLERGFGAYPAVSKWRPHLDRGDGTCSARSIHSWQRPSVEPASPSRAFNQVWSPASSPPRTTVGWRSRGRCTSRHPCLHPCLLSLPLPQPLHLLPHQCWPLLTRAPPLLTLAGPC